MVKQYQVCKPKETLMSVFGNVISKDSEVVVLSIDGCDAIVCRFGNYKDWVKCPVSFLNPIS